MDINTIRKVYTDFFRSKEHEVVPSAPMVIKNDPTLMFTNAGMNQFKDYFLGNENPKHKRVTNAQKCLRVSGKHNDLEEVGVDTYHHTMFEMLGNWSFGDYFKKEAIEWAWELLTEKYKIDSKNLYVTIFGGDEKDGVEEDTEAFNIWKNLIPDERILRAGKKDNFWEMGEIGPCGPCSEIHIDIRSDSEKQKVDGKTLVNQDHPQVIEIWNLVFMQFNRKSDGSLENLPQKHVDTGMGLERLAMVLQGKTSNYDTDLFQKIINHLAELAGKKYGDTETADIALRVIADHIRAVAFSIADGQLPSNNGAGYVIRRILRRAVRYGYQTLEISDPFMHKLVPTLCSLMGEAYPELKKQEKLIHKVILEEEDSFYKTLEQGLKKLDELITKLSGNKKIAGDSVFELYDTYGFPADLTSLIAKERGLTIDEEGFQKALQEQKNRSREAGKISSGDWTEITQGNSDFIGYDQTACDSKILKYREITYKKETFYQLVLNPTPFYPEGGGQVGDQGILEDEDEKIAVQDTKKENNLIVHTVKKLPKNLQAVLKARVDIEKRKATAINHSATHLLHFALREILGPHVEQKGSLVHPDYLRFDFSHFSKVEEIAKIEARVNEMIREGIKLNEQRNVPIQKAMDLGAMALFGEKYGDDVRVIQFGPSIELCGGTHVKNTGTIGFFKITSESAVASGVRRIEAITSEKAADFIQEKLSELENIRQFLKVQDDTFKAVKELQNKSSQLEKKIEKLEAENAQSVKKEWIDNIKKVGEVSFLGLVSTLDNTQIKNLLFQLRNEHKDLVAVIGNQQEDKATLSILIADRWVKEKDWNAGTWVREIASKHIAGGGGGQAFFATAGGKNPAGLQKAIDEVKDRLF